MVWSMPMLHNSGSTFNTDNASRFYNPRQDTTPPGTNRLQFNKMHSIGTDTTFYSFDDTANLPAGAGVINLTNIDGFSLNASYDYEMILEGSFSVGVGDGITYDPNTTYDVAFKRGFITSIDTFINAHDVGRFSSNSTGGSLNFRRYVGINMDYETTYNNFVWTLENVSYDTSQYSAPGIRGIWTAYVIEARREIDGTL